MKNNDMLCALQADLFKLKKHKSVWIGMAVMFAVILLSYCIYWAALMLPSILTDGESVIVLPISALNRAMLASHSENGMLSFLTLIITCIFIGKEFSNGSFRIMVSRGANRIKLYFSKWITLACLVAAYSVFAFVISGIFTSFTSYGVEFTANEFGLLMRCFFLQLLCNLSVMSIVVMLAFLIRSSGGSLGAGIGLFIALSVVLSIVDAVAMFNPNINSDWIIFMPLQQSSVATSLEQLATNELCAVLIMPIVYIALSIAIGLLTFIKRDIK